MRAFLAVFVAVVAVTAGTNTTQDFNTARSLIAGGDFEEVSNPIMNIREQVAALNKIPRDYSLAKLSRLSTPETLLATLAQAEQFVARNDTANAIRSLDMAYFSAIDLTTKQTPSQRLASAMSNLATDKSLHGGVASPVSILRTARAEYLVGDFVQSQQFALQATKYPHEKQGAILVHNEFVLAGLSELGLGNEEQAAVDLLSSVQALGAAVGGVPRFDLSLAKALVKQRPTAVITFLDSAALHPEWKDRMKVPVWKSQIEAGQVPDFGDAALSVH